MTQLSRDPIGLDDLFEDAIAEAQADAVTEGSHLVTLLRDLEGLEEAIEYADKALSGLKERRRALVELSIPDEMMKMGNLTKLKTDEVEIEVKPFYSAKVLDFAAAEQYLTAAGFGGIIKAVCEVPIGRLAEENVGLLADLHAKLGELGLGYEDKKSIHSSTLAAFVKEQLTKEGGLTFPEDKFSVYQGRAAKVKKLK